MRPMRPRLPALAVVGVCLLAATASAQNAPSPEFTAEYQKGTDAYRTGNYDEAIVHLEAAKKLDPTLPGPWRFLGVVFHDQGNWKDCIDSTREALRLNPTSSQAADTRTVHDECRASAGRAQFTGTFVQASDGAISVTTDQVGAAVEINGISYGSTPVIKTIPAGPVEVKVSKSGYLPATMKLDVLAQIVNDADFILQVDPTIGSDLGLGGHEELTTGWVKIVTTVVGVVVEVDGKPATMDDQGRYVVDAGDHYITVTADGRETYSKKVRVSKGQLISVKAELRSQGDVSATRKKGRVLVYTGVGLAIVGAAFGMLSLDATDTARDYWTIEVKRPTFTVDFTEADSDAVAPIHTRAEIDDLASRGKTLGIVSTAMIGASVVAIGVGAYFLVKGRPRGDKAEIEAALVPLEHGAAALAEVRW